MLCFKSQLKCKTITKHSHSTWVREEQKKSEHIYLSTVLCFSAKNPSAWKYNSSALFIWWRMRVKPVYCVCVCGNIKTIQMYSIYSCSGIESSNVKLGPPSKHAARRNISANIFLFPATLYNNTRDKKVIKTKPSPLILRVRVFVCVFCRRRVCKKNNMCTLRPVL